MTSKRRKEMDKLLLDHEQWDNRELGASEVHMKVLTDSQQKELDREIDEGLGLQHISIRLNKNLIEHLKHLAQLEGIGYQPLIRQILTRYAKDNEYKLDSRLSASEAASRADRLFMQSLTFKSQISKMKPLSNERIQAETDYSQILKQALLLFTQAHERANDPVLKQHAKLRLAQIADICQCDSSNQGKKNGKRKRGQPVPLEDLE